MSSNILIDQINANRAAQANGAASPSIENQSGNPLIDRINYNRANPKAKEDAKIAASSDYQKGRRGTEEELSRGAYQAAQEQGYNIDTWYSKAEDESNAASERYNQLKAQLDDLSAKRTSQDNGSLFGSVMAKARGEDTVSDDELSNLQKAVEQAKADSDKKSAEFRYAKQYKDYRDTTRPVDEAAERGVSYRDQYDAYSQSLSKMQEQRDQLMQQLKELDKKYSRANSDLDFETRKRMYDEEKESTTARLEKLEREIARIEGTKSYAEKYLTKDASAKRVVEWGRELAKLADRQNSQLHEKAKEEQRQAINMAGGMAGLAYDANLRRTSKDAYRPTAQWTKDQEDLFYFYFGSPDFGPKVAEDYAARINYAYNTGAISEKTKAAESWGAGADSSVPSKIGRGVAGIAGSIASMPFAAADYMNKMLEVSANGRYAGRDFVMPNDYTEAVTRGRSEQLNKDYGTANLPIVGAKGLGDVYQLTQSMAQSLSIGNLVGEAATLGAFFFQSANSSFDEAMRRGASAEYAALYSVLCGTAEVAFEKISLDKLLTNKDWSKQLVKELVSQGLVEGSEELFTSLANEMNERIAAAATGQRPQMEQKISALVAQGMTLKDAQHQVYSEFVSDLAWDAIGGAISGFGSGAVQSGVRGTQNKLWEMRKDSVLGKQSGAHVAGKDGKAIGSKASNATDAQLEKLLVQAEKRGDLQTALFIANELINREEAGQRQRHTGDPNSTSMLAERILDGMRRKAGVIQDSDGLGETPLNDDELPPPYEEERPPMPGDEEAPPEWANRPQQEPTAGEQRNGNEPPARSDREAPPAWRNRNADLGSAQQKSALELELDEQEAEMRQNAARAQRASKGQITQPNQQNAAQTVKPGDYGVSRSNGKTSTAMVNDIVDRMPEHRNFDYSTIRTVKPGNSERKKSDSRPKLEEGQYYLRDDKVGGLSAEGIDAVKKAYSEEFERLKNGERHFTIEAPDGSVHSIAVGPAGYGNSGASWYIDPNGLRGDAPYLSRTYQGYRDGHAENKEEALAYAIEIVRFDIGSDKDFYDWAFSLPSPSLTTSTESGTMSVPNTQEVTTNAGEQAVQQSEETAAGESDAGRPVRESGERTSDGLLGGQRTYEEGVPGQQSRESEADEGAPSFVTEQDLKTLPSENEVRPLTPQQKSSFKDALKDTNDGTEAVTRPKLGSRLHFVQNFLTKIGVDQDVLFATNRSDSVFKDERKGTHNSGKAIISADIDGLDLLPTAIHEVSHKKFFEKFGGMAVKDVVNGSYKRRMSVFTKAFMDAFDPMKALNIMNEAQNLVTKDYNYEKKYAKERGGRVSAINKELARTGRYLGTDAKSLVQEMEKARSLEEFANELIAWDDVFLEAVNDKLGLSYEEIANLRGKLLSALEGEGAVTKEYITAINDAVQEWQDLDGEFTDDELEFPDFGLSGDLFGDIADSDASNFGNNEERRRELGAALRALISGDTEAIQRLSDDTLNYAINYTLKQADPDLDFKEKRRSYNVIANILSGENLSRSGLRRDADANLISPQFGTADSIMQKGGGRRNQLYDFVSAGKLRDVHSDEYVSREHVSNEGKEFGRYQTISTDEERATNRERAVLINAINELDRRGLNIWGSEQAQGESGTTDDFEKKEKTWWEEPEFSETDRYDQLAGDYADEVDEDIGRYEKTQATKDLKRMREGDNWLQGTVKVDPEVKEWGRGAKKTAGQKTQGWYDINRRSSLAEREFARQRVMNARAAEDLSFEIQTMEDQAADIREEVERARRNSPAAKESLKMIDGLLEDLNSDIDDLHAIDDMFRDAVREDPNSDMTKQLAAEGTRLASEIESLRRDIDTLGRLANESIGNNNSEELRDAEKRLKKQEQKIKAKREHLQELLDKSRGGNTSGALVASRAETAFDSMPDDVIKQIIRNGYVSMDMLQDYYGNADAAYQTMYEFQERVGETGKTRIPSVHKLTSLEKTALHGILAERKNNSKITSGYGGVEMSEDLPERSPSAPASMSKAEYTEAMQQEYGPYISDEQRKKSKSKSANDKRIPATVQPITNEAISERNRRAYQSSKFNGGMVLEPTGPTPANMDRLNRMFADRLGIENKGTTAGAIGTPKSFYDSDASDFGTNKGQKKTPLIVDAAYTNYAAAAQSVADLHKKIVSDIMAENPNAEPDFIDKQIEDSFLGNSVRALDTAVSQIANSKDPLGAVFNLRQQLYSAKNKGEGTYAALTSDAVIGMCDEIGRLIENKTMPYDEKARAYAVATTQLVSALSTRAERLYDAAHRVQRIQDKLATVTKKDRGKLREALTGYKIMQMNPTTLFKMLDNFDVGGKGAGYEIARELENGTVKSAELIARAARQFDEAKKTEGFQEFAEGKTNARYKLKGEYTISELQAIEFILLARRMNGMKVYDVDAHGGVVEKTRLQTLKGFALRDADGNHIFVDSMYEDSRGKKKRFDWYKEAESMYRNLSPAAKAYLKAVNKVMDGLGKEIRQAKINATGVGFTGMEGTGYYPISYMSDKEHLPDYNTKPDYEGLSHDRHLESPRLTHGGYAVVQNAAQRVDRYVEWASNYAGFADIADMLQTMNVSGNGRGIVNATADAYGVKYAKAIERYIGDVNNFTDVSRESTENSTIRALRQNMAAGVLGLSLSVPIKQVASYWDAAGILSMDSLRRAYRVKAFVKEKGLGTDNMFLKSRKVGNVDPTVSEMMGSGLMDNLKKRSSIVKLFAEATNRMDYKTVDNLFTATVLDVEANLPGIDKNSELFKRAVEAKFNQVVLNTQPIFNKNARSEYQRSSNEWQRMFAMFRTQQTQNFNRLIVTTMEARAAKGTSLETATKRQLRQTIAGQVAGQLEFAALTAIANFVMHGWKRWRDDDDEITVESVVKRFGLDALESIAGTAWFGDEIAKMLVDGAFGTNESFGVSMGVLSSVVDTAKYLFDIIGDVAKDNPLDIFDSARKFVGAGASLFGLPVNNLYRLANAAVMWGADALKWASKGKYGNRANYDDSMKMLDAWIKGGLKEEGAKKQAAKAFRKDQPENLLYNLGILSSLTSKDSKVDKGTDWLNTRIQGKTEAERKAYKENELARLGRNLNAGERIANYLADSALSAAQKDEAISKFATTSGYNVLYESLRAAGMTPKAAVEELGKTDNKTGLSTDIRSDDSLADLYSGKDNPGDTNDVPALDKKNTDEYVNFVSAMKVFRDTGNYSQLDKLVDQYSKLDANTRAVIDAKDSAMKRYREYRSMGLSTKDYYNVKDAIKQAQIDLDLAANTGTAVKLVGLSKANLTKAQIQKLVNSEALGISKTGKSLISVLSKYGYTVGDIGMFMYNTDWTNDDANGTLSQQEVVLALAKEKRLTDAQRSAIYEELKPLLRNEYKINHWYDKSYEYELNYLLQNGKTSGRAS